MGSHEFSWNQKIVADGFPWSLSMELKNIVFPGNWNPRAWVRSTLTEMLFDSVAPLVNITSLGSAPINSATCCKREIMITFKKILNKRK